MACEFHQLEKDNFGTDLNDMGLKKMSINMTCDFHYVNYIFCFQLLKILILAQ